jgi:hypothetical protein
MSERIMASLVGAALALIGTAAGAAGDFTSANFWMPFCRAYVEGKGLAADIQYIGQCAGLVAGTAYVAPDLPAGKCADVPNGVEYTQLISVVVRYINQRPERMHEHFGKLTVEALHAAWPCR